MSLKGGAIFDADFHVEEQPGDFLPYIEEPYKQVFDTDDHEDFKDTYPHPGSFSEAISGKVLRDGLVNDSESIQRGMDKLELDHVLIQPTRNTTLACVQDGDLAIALARAYNDWMLDEIVDPDLDIFASIQVAPQRPTESAEEIARLKDEPGFKAVHIPCAGCYPLLGNRKYDPIYSKIEQSGLPIVLHPAGLSSMQMAFPVLFRNLDKPIKDHLLSFPFQHMAHMTDMIFSAVPERYPDLTIVIQEAGLGWIPYITRRMDNHYNLRRQEVPELERMPSEYVDDQFYFSTQPLEGHKDTQYISAMTELVGAENILFASDYPHYDFDYPEDIVTLFNGVDNQSSRGIAAETALDVFDI